LRIIAPLSSGLNISEESAILGLLDPEDGDPLSLQSIRKYLANDTA